MPIVKRKVIHRDPPLGAFGPGDLGPDIQKYATSLADKQYSGPSAPAVSERIMQLLKGNTTEEAYLTEEKLKLLLQSSDFYKKIGLNLPNNFQKSGPSLQEALVELFKATHTGRWGDATPKRLPARLFALQDPFLPKGQRTEIPSIKMNVGRGAKEYMNLTGAGPLDLVKYKSMPMIDIDTPTTGRHKEVHPESGITAGSKGEALEKVQKIANILKSRLRTYMTPGGIRAFDISKENTVQEFIQRLEKTEEGQALSAILDPHYMTMAKRVRMYRPKGREQIGISTHGPAPIFIDDSGFASRTGPKFNRNPNEDYVATLLGDVVPSSGSAPEANANMFEQLLNTHDTRIAANTTNNSSESKMLDLIEVIKQGVPAKLREQIMRKYKL